MEPPRVNQAVLQLLPKLERNSNRQLWADNFCGVIKAESEDLWAIILGEFEPEMDLTSIPIPTAAEARAAASTYWGLIRASPAQIEEYLHINVHRINKAKSTELKRIRQLHSLAYFYINAAVSKEMRWMISGETNPAACFAHLSRPYTGDESDTSHNERRELSSMKFQGSGVQEAMAFITDWFQCLTEAQNVDPTLLNAPAQYFFFLDTLTENDTCDDWINMAKFNFGHADHPSTMAEVFHSFLNYQSMLEISSTAPSASSALSVLSDISDSIQD